MAKIDQAKIQHIISTIKASPPPGPGPGPIVRQRPPISKPRLAGAKMLEATLAKAGLDVTEFNKLMAQDRLEGRAFLKKELAGSAYGPAAAELSYRQRVDASRKVANLLTPDFFPRNTTQIDAPFYISQSPSSPILKSGAIEPNGSYIKILVETNANNDTGGVFTFWYLWENDSAEDLAISVVTDLIISGAYSIEANPGELWGLFGSDSVTLEISNYIQTFRYSGWGTDPTTGQSNDNSYYPIPAGIGSSPFSTGVPNQGSYFEQGLFDNLFSQIGQGLMFVPAGAVALFHVNHSLYSAFSSGGGNIADLIEIDLNSGGYGVYSPSLWVSTWFRVPPFR